jgi:acyl carrier protein
MAKNRHEEELMQVVKKIAEEAMDVDLSNATPQTQLRSLEMDSLDLLEFVSNLEDHLQVCIPDSQIKELETVGGLIAVLMALQAAQPAGDGGRPAGAGDEERPADASR